MRRASNIGVLSDSEIADKNWIYFRRMGSNSWYCPRRSLSVEFISMESRAAAQKLQIYFKLGYIR